MGKRRRARVKRSFPKKFSANYIHVQRFGAGPGQSAIMGYNRKVAQTEAEFLACFNIPPNKPRQLVIQLRQFLEMREQDTTFDRFVVLSEGKYHRTRMVHLPNDGGCYLLYESYLKRQLSRSVTYKDRAQAIDRYKNKNILWKEHLFL